MPGLQNLRIGISWWSVSLFFILFVGPVAFLCFLSRRFSRRRRRQIAIVSVLFLVLGTFLWIALSDAVGHYIELNIVRASPVHGFFQTAESQTVVPMHPELIVFQHIPRTAGDAMRTHLFHDVDFEFCPLYISEAKSPPIPRSFSKMDDEIQEWRLIKGYFSREDLMELGTLRSLRTFTFLRDPIERCLSFYNFLGRAPTATAYFDRNSSWMKESERHRLHTLSFVNDGMTWQLGNWIHLQYRNMSMSDQEVLSCAKNALEKMDFVGFYENLPLDFWRLRDEIFPDVSVPYIYPFLFWVGALLSLPRLRVKRYSARVDSEVLDLVRSLNNLDIQLYEWARVRFEQDYVIYNSFADFALAQAGWITALLLIIGCLAAVVWYIRRQNNNRVG